MKSTFQTHEILTAIYNDKEVLKKVKKSVEEYSINLRSMEQLRQDSKDIEKYVKDTYGIGATVFKKIVKSSMVQNDNVDELIEELQMIREIAKSE